MKTLYDAWLSEEAVSDKSQKIVNNIIDHIDILIVGHLGNLAQLEIYGNGGAKIFSGYNNTHNIGYILRDLVEFFDLTQEDGLKLSEIRNVPCRLIINEWGVVLGIGHFMKNRFIYLSSLLKVDNQLDAI